MKTALGFFFFLSWSAGLFITTYGLTYGDIQMSGKGFMLSFFSMTGCILVFPNVKK